MKKEYINSRDLIYLCVSIILVFLIAILFWNYFSLRSEFRLTVLQNVLQGDLLQAELEPYYLGEASKDGLYHAPSVVLFGDNNASLDLYVKNIGRTPANFSILVLPNTHITTYLPYENISIGYYRGNFSLLSNEHVKLPVKITTSLYDFREPNENNTLPQFFVLLRSGNSTYSFSNFTIFAIPQKVIDDL